MKTLLKLFDTIVLDSSECHLHYYDFKHSLKKKLKNLEEGGGTEWNWFLINLSTFKINYFSAQAAREVRYVTQNYITLVQI